MNRKAVLIVAIVLAPVAMGSVLVAQPATAGTAASPVTTDGGSAVSRGGSDSSSGSAVFTTSESDGSGGLAAFGKNDSDGGSSFRAASDGGAMLP